MKARIALSALLLAAPATAQAPSSVLLAPGSTRALALGDAFVLGSDDSDVIFYNAAAGGSGVSAGIGLYEDARLLGLSAAASWWGLDLLLGLRSHGPVGGVTDDALALAVGIDALGIDLAMTGRLIERRVGATRAGGAAADIALSTRAGPVRLGLAARNLGPDIDGGSPTLDGELPTRFVLSAATRSLEIGPLDLVAAARAASDRDGEIEAGGGLELAYWPIRGRTFAARAGTMRDRDGDTTMTYGAGFEGDRIAIDWAFHDAGDGAHRITVRWR